MTDINLNAHYSNNPKVEHPARPIASAPQELPKVHLFNDKDANNRLKNISQDIYTDSKKEENRAGLRFLKIFGIFVCSILMIKGLKALFKKS